MQFVDEQDRVLGTLHFVHDRLDAFFELTAVLGSGDHHRQVEYDDPLFTQQFGDFTVDHHRSKAFDDRGFTDTCFTEQNRIVLLASAQDLDDAFDFVGTANDGIEFPLASQFCQVATKTVQSWSLALACLARCGCLASPGAFGTPFATFHAVAEKIQNFFADVFQLQPEIHQNLCGDTFLFPDQTEQQVFGTDVVMVEVTGLFHRVLDHLLGARSLRKLAHRDHIGPRLDDLFDFQTDLAQVNLKVLQHIGGNAGSLFDEAEQDVLSTNVFVIEPLGFLIGQLHHFAGAIGESLVHSEASGDSRGWVAHRK